ncbi:hypothetical protein RB195_014284 [Necator americanus]|uniref:Uncharacterized protein n=1 Tax=Necator americanus TaxID=51031 RepID=A0ABR1DZE2_NECAM
MLELHGRSLLNEFKRRARSPFAKCSSEAKEECQVEHYSRLDGHVLTSKPTNLWSAQLKQQHLTGEHSAQTNRDEGRCESAAHIRKKSNIRRYPANKMVEVMIERNGIVCSTQKTSCSLLLSSHSSLHPYPSNRPSQCLLDQSDTSFPKRKKDLVSTLRRGEINRSGGPTIWHAYVTKSATFCVAVFYAECLDKSLKMRDSRQLSKLQI